MFNNIGKKIKTLAKVICWIGIVLSFIIGFTTMIANAVVLSRGNDSEFVIVMKVLFICLFTFGIGSLLSWIGSFCLYGFGELIDKATEIAENTANPICVVNSIDKKTAPLHAIKEDGIIDDKNFAKDLNEFYREDTTDNT